MNEFVLVKGSNSVFMGTVAIMSVDEWERRKEETTRPRPSSYGRWQEVMRGTWDEVNAVAKLMPEPLLRKNI